MVVVMANRIIHILRGPSNLEFIIFIYRTATKVTVLACAQIALNECLFVWEKQRPIRKPLAPHYRLLTSAKILKTKEIEYLAFNIRV